MARATEQRPVNRAGTARWRVFSPVDGALLGSPDDFIAGRPQLTNNAPAKAITGLIS